jgi:8-oxo-dGTP diphosphatase
VKNFKDIQDFIENGEAHFLPNVSLDCAIFGYHERMLKVLLLDWKTPEGWSLPGGRIFRNEALAAAASRTVEERTGLTDLFLQQYYTFGDSEFRHSKTRYTSALRKYNINIEKGNWLLDRTLTIGYYALVEYSMVNPRPDLFTVECRWWDVNEVPQLLFDHNELIDRALVTMRRDIYHQPIGYNLLPEKFTLPEIHDLYETILGKQLDRRNFPKKLLATGIIKKLAERRSIGPHRSPFLYRFDKRVYDKALREGWALAF